VRCEGKVSRVKELGDGDVHPNRTMDEWWNEWEVIAYDKVHIECSCVDLPCFAQQSGNRTS
jgi:hypothetical protein